MQKISVYDVDYENIMSVCNRFNVTEWEVIEALFDILYDEKIDISEWL